ncbi:MAG TPA: hypothetical protein VFW52_01690 [Candidatus Saccharimonadales bacterium]|nr:hypothetical protein [Candidatus Saccharimonadales bacterium]
MKHRFLAASTLLITGLGLVFTSSSSAVLAATQSSSGAVGVEATIPSAPPSTAPTISTPANGQSFTTLPITVAGICQNDLLVEVFKNGVFSGSVTCTNNSYSLQIDLFSGRNDLIARQYDALNQASPDSNKVTVTFSDSLPQGTPRVTLTTAYAKRGAAPGEELTWPIAVSGGTPPFALSIDWGDKSSPELISRSTPGDVLLKHIYSQAGVYNIIVKASDSKGSAAFLQLVGIGNGPIQQASATNKPATKAATNLNRVLLISSLILIPLLFAAFWLGRKHQLQVIRSRIRRGDRPF